MLPVGYSHTRPTVATGSQLFVILADLASRPLTCSNCSVQDDPRLEISTEARKHVQANCGARKGWEARTMRRLPLSLKSLMCRFAILQQGLLNACPKLGVPTTTHLMSSWPKADIVGDTLFPPHDLHLEHGLKAAVEHESV